jgi:hypothetical protein
VLDTSVIVIFAVIARVTLLHQALGEEAFEQRRQRGRRSHDCFSL